VRDELGGAPFQSTKSCDGLRVALVVVGPAAA